MPTDSPATPTQRLAETLLGQSLDEWVGARRARGLSWKSIAADLAVTTDGIVDVNRETMRVWYLPPRPDDEVEDGVDEVEVEAVVEVEVEDDDEIIEVLS